MIIYYVKQFNLYYAGTRDGTLKFANARRDAVAFQTRKYAEDKCKDIDEDTCEIEERDLG